MKINIQSIDFQAQLSYNSHIESAGDFMIINEKFIMGKHPDQSLCEDALFISDDFIAVLDGVTSKSDKKFNDMPGGKAATQIAIDVLKNVPANIIKAELFQQINNAVASLYNGTPTGEAAVCMIVYSNHHKEVWAIGDCQCIINNKSYTHEKLIDKELSELRSRVIAEALKNGTTITEIAENDIGRQAIMPQLMAQHQYANRTDHPYGYAVLNGTPIDPEAIVTYAVKNGDMVILASDGYPRLFDTLQKSEDYLAHILKTDPLCFNEYKSSKGLKKGNLSFDDRTYIKFIV